MCIHAVVSMPGARVFPGRRPARGAGDVRERSSLAASVCLFNMGGFDKALAEPGSHSLGGSLGRKRKPPRRSMRGEPCTGWSGCRMWPSSCRPPARCWIVRTSSPAQAAEAADAEYWLGWSLYRLGRLTEARDAFLSLSGKHPADPRAAEAEYRAVSARRFAEMMRLR